MSSELSLRKTLTVIAKIVNGSTLYVERKADPSVATAAAFALESLDLVPWWNADLVILSVEHFGPERMLPKGLKLEVLHFPQGDA